MPEEKSNEETAVVNYTLGSDYIFAITDSSGQRAMEVKKLQRDIDMAMAKTDARW